jgi:DNA-binding response OmpR family regulator
MQGMADDGSRRRIVLVVDDDTAAREGLVEFLRDEGFDARAAVDGVDALAAFDRYRPVLVITDIQMPRMDGRALIATLQERGDAGPIVVLTAVMTIDAERQAAQLGVDGYINKPVDLDELLRRVHDLLRTHEGG